MKALVYTDPFKLEYMDYPEPQVSKNDVLVKVEAVGICGSDLHAYQGHDARRKPPLVLGHEVVGEAQNGIYQGENVIINPLTTCLTCTYCRGGKTNLCLNRQLIGMNQQGGFADYVLIREDNCIPIKRSFKPQEAVLTEPVATAYHGIKLMTNAFFRPIQEANVLVIGGGSVGLAAALLLKSYGCAKVVLSETNQKRIDKLKKSCEIDIINPVEQKGNFLASFHCVVDAVGSAPSRDFACKHVEPGGVILHIGLSSDTGSLDIRKITLSEVAFIGSYTYEHLDLVAAAKIIESGKLGPFSWVDSRKLEEGAEAFSELSSGKSQFSKIVLCPS